MTIRTQVKLLIVTTHLYRGEMADCRNVVGSRSVLARLSQQCDKRVHLSRDTENDATVATRRL